MTDSSTPNNSEDQVNSPDNSESGATENKPKIRLSLKKPSPEEEANSAEVEEKKETSDSPPAQEAEQAKPKMSLRREPADDTGEKQEQPSEPLINEPPPEIASPPEQEQVTEKVLVPDTEDPPPPPSSEDVSADPLVPEIEEPSPVPEEKKLSTKPPIPPPQKIKSKEEEQEPPSDNVKPPPPPPPKVKKPEVQKVETAGVKKPKSTSNTGAFFKIAAAFIFVALLFVGAIYLITKAFTSDTTKPADEEAITQEVTPPPAPTSSITKLPSSISDIQSPYTDPDSDFGEIYMDPNSPFSEPTDTKEPSPTITRNVRPSIAKDPSPSQPPSSGEPLTEDTAPSEVNNSPPPVVHKPTPDPAVVDFLNGLVVQGVKSKGNRHAALLNGNVYNVNSTVSDELEIRLIEVDGSARHLIFKDKNGVRYRKPY